MINEVNRLGEALLKQQAQIDALSERITRLLEHVEYNYARKRGPKTEDMHRGETEAAI